MPGLIGHPGSLLCPSLFGKARDDTLRLRFLRFAQDRQDRQDRQGRLQVVPYGHMVSACRGGPMCPPFLIPHKKKDPGFPRSPAVIPDPDRGSSVVAFVFSLRSWKNKPLDSRVRGNDKKGAGMTERGIEDPAFCHARLDRASRVFAFVFFLRFVREGERPWIPDQVRNDSKRDRASSVLSFIVWKGTGRHAGRPLQNRGICV